MARSLNLFFRLSLPELERIVKDYQDEFDQVLEDTFTDEELQLFEKKIDSIAALYVQPISSELSFDDFYADPKQELKQQHFFEECRSSICLDNLPYFEDNPFQVSYLKDLLWSFDEVLIDRGGVNELMFRKEFLEELKSFPTMDSLLKDVPPLVHTPKTNIPVTPIDFLVQDIYKELNRLEGKELSEDLPEKTLKILKVMQKNKTDSESLFMLTGLNAKDFDDHLEKLKFWLRKIPT